MIGEHPVFGLGLVAAMTFHPFTSPTVLGDDDLSPIWIAGIGIDRRRRLVLGTYQRVQRPLFGCRWQFSVRSSMSGRVRISPIAVVPPRLWTFAYPSPAIWRQIELPAAADGVRN